MRADTCLCLLKLCVVGTFPMGDLGPVESLGTNWVLSFSYLGLYD